MVLNDPKNLPVIEVNGEWVTYILEPHQKHLVNYS